jgi:hypothetical protein
MNPTPAITQLLDIERRFWSSIQKKDGPGTGAMTDDGCIIVGAQGVSAIDQKSMAKMTQESKWELQEYSFDDKTAQVRMIGDDLAIVAYRVSERIVVEGQTLSFDANDSSVWMKRNGKWVCVLHTESLAGDPFGRDKKPPPAK